MSTVDEASKATPAKASPDELAALYNATLSSAGVAGWENLESADKGSYANLLAELGKQEVVPLPDVAKAPNEQYTEYLDALAKQDLSEAQRAALKSSIFEGGGDAP